MRKRTTVTLRDGEKVLAALKAQMGFYLDSFEIEGEVFTPITTEQPSLVMDWDWPGESTPSILWEAGPYDWTMYFPFGGRTEEGITLKDVSDRIPDHVFIEPWAGWGTCMYPNG